MARVKIRMYATVREGAGASEIDLEAASLAEVVDLLERRYGSPLKEMLKGFPSDPERLVVLVNGRNESGRDARAFKLREGDEISVFPPISGG